MYTIRLTGLSVVRLKILQYLFFLHDFVLSLVQLDPKKTQSDQLLKNTKHLFYIHLDYMCAIILTCERPVSASDLTKRKGNVIVDDKQVK